MDNMELYKDEMVALINKLEGGIATIADKYEIPYNVAYFLVKEKLGSDLAEAFHEDEISEKEIEKNEEIGR